MARIVKLGSFVAVIHRQHKTAPKPPARFLNPFAHVKIYLGLLALPQSNPLLLKICFDLGGGKRAAYFGEAFAIMADVDFTQGAMLEENTMHGKRIEQFI